MTLTTSQRMGERGKNIQLDGYERNLSKNDVDLDFTIGYRESKK